jgi:hypothetical protein
MDDSQLWRPGYGPVRNGLEVKMLVIPLVRRERFNHERHALKAALTTLSW